jgi:TubC N-terminal docking domain
LERGVAITTDNDKLGLDAPHGTVTADLLARIRACKRELLATLSVAKDPGGLPDKLQRVWEERAAIMEYDGGLPRVQAEALALTDTLLCGVRTPSLNRATPDANSESQIPRDGMGNDTACTAVHDHKIVDDTLHRTTECDSALHRWTGSMDEESRSRQSGFERYQNGGWPHTLLDPLRKMWLDTYVTCMQRGQSEQTAWNIAWAAVKSSSSRR